MFSLFFLISLVVLVVISVLVLWVWWLLIVCGNGISMVLSFVVVSLVRVSVLVW